MSVADFRKFVKQNFPHVKVSIRTVSFEDLARGEKKFLTIKGDRNADEFQAINEKAKQAGVIPDGNVRFN